MSSPAALSGEANSVMYTRWFDVKLTKCRKQSASPSLLNVSNCDIEGTSGFQDKPQHHLSCAVQPKKSKRGGKLES